MTDHLPECGYGIELSFDGLIQPAEPCICDRLRQCEQRVFQEQIVGRQHDMVLGYQRGLAAARRAVQVLPKGGMGLKAHALWRDALAAIDALRKEKK